MWLLANSCGHETELMILLSHELSEAENQEKIIEQWHTVDRNHTQQKRKFAFRK
jgi:hypothetical protein